MDIFNYSRRETSEVIIGNIAVGNKNPIRLQSMTNTSTQDTEACVEQAKKIIDAGGDYVRLTTQGMKEAENLKNINASLRSQGYMNPLVADIHFTPKVADIAALYAEKVRINPGNYLDAPRTFKQVEYTDEEYAQELLKIRERLVTFLNICKANNTAIRIGVNHGSLSDRIMTRYGDTPEGMVESCMEFLRICISENFTNIVISIKASNTIVMVRTVRLLVEIMKKEGMNFPLHLGVTEAGDGEDGRIKSALGIGTLLSDGYGDTIRVSLSEDPEAEIPVAKKLVNYIAQRANHPYIPGLAAEGFNFLAPERRKTVAVKNIGGNNVPVVIAERMDNKFEVNPQFVPDYIYAARTVPSLLEERPEYILDADIWESEKGELEKMGKKCWPAFNHTQLYAIGDCQSELKFLFMPYMALTDEVIACLRVHPEIVLLSQSNHPNRVGEHRASIHQLTNEGITNPVITFQHYAENEAEDLQVKSAADMGAIILDGLCDGIFIYNQGNLSHAIVDATAFGILQAGRMRTSKTEYISCPGCGRTLFSLQNTIARVKAATSHLKGLKIGIMGCIVNGPGEMADADYGYVGAGKGRISLYKQKECIERNIPEEEAVDKLIALIKENGDYSEE